MSRAARAEAARRSAVPRMNILIAKPMPPRISAPPTTRPIADCVAVRERARDLHADERQRRRADEHPERERRVHVAEAGGAGHAPNDLKIAPCRMSVPTAAFGSKPKSRISIGVIRLPPPMPVMPTRIPTAAPAIANCQVRSAFRGMRAGDERACRAARRRACTPRSRCRSRSRRRAARARRRAAPSAAPSVGKPAAYATDAAASTTSPTMFAARGGRESSSWPSPKRGWISSKYARHGRQ